MGVASPDKFRYLMYMNLRCVLRKRDVTRAHESDRDGIPDGHWYRTISLLPFAHTVATVSSKHSMTVCTLHVHFGCRCTVCTGTSGGAGFLFDFPVQSRSPCVTQATEACRPGFAVLEDDIILTENQSLTLLLCSDSIAKQ